MKFSAIALLVAGVSAWSSSQNATVAYTTDVVTALTTYCPAATQVTHNGVTYTVTEATTLTITNCPCTITHPVSSSPVWTSTSAPYTWPNATATTVKSSTVASASATSSKPASFTGAAGRLSAAGAGVAAIAGVVAALV